MIISSNLDAPRLPSFASPIEELSKGWGKRFSVKHVRIYDAEAPLRVIQV